MVYALFIVLIAILVVNGGCLILLGRISIDSQRETARRVTEIYHQQYDVAAYGPVNLLETANGINDPR